MARAPVGRRAADFGFFDAPFLAFAHRGGAAYPANRGHENTLAAFQAAVDLGYRYLETDVHATRDGRLVAFHDERLDRVTDRTGAIAELTFDEVRTAVVGDGYQIPTLAELLHAFPAARFNIDCKAEDAVDLLAREILEHEVVDRVCVSSFGVHRLRRLRELLPAVPTAVSSRAIVQLRFAPFLTRLPVISNLVHSPGVALQLPVTTPVAGRQVAVLTERLVTAAHQAGRQVHVWTIDDAAEMNRLIDLGVDGIFTDRIDTLKDVLARRGLWSAA
ncbi:glycerophosphoryl diester phosphodiesterase [Microlunatus endophyticus]|uniref:Glycerophosphoryl diester phosphodiesterase n=1 Tax=Microlunatus endophyticus TaxID=1716077 RepID=A0A917S531_9ACTN|nr:glycerophosphodiester phosphodiesterase family protein [Microlunatus endophyticus]GGL54084.1 glycerophosphoryl diester phosphodiesterase [Microlunatus endophyticus]